MNTCRDVLIARFAPLIVFGTDTDSHCDHVLPILQTLPAELRDEDTTYRLASVFGLAELRLGRMEDDLDVSGIVPDDNLRTGIDEAMRVAARFALVGSPSSLHAFRCRLETLTDARLHALAVAALKGRDELLREFGCSRDFVLMHGWCAGFFHDLLVCPRDSGALAAILPAVSAIAPAAQAAAMPLTVAHRIAARGAA